MSLKSETTTLITSVDADVEQSVIKFNQSIAENVEPVNRENDDLEKWQKEMHKMSLPSYMPTVSMSQLYETVYTNTLPIVDGLLYVGTYLFVGAPKMGKSFFVAQLAYHVATGTPLWNYPAQKGTVLYLALEDDYKRLQGRLFRMFGTDSTENLYFSTSAKQLGKGLDEQLKGFINEHQNTNLIIIDTLQKIRECGGDGYGYASDYDIITRLKNFASDNNICLLLVHHTRKQTADDKFEMISGTNGILGASDGAFLLRKEKRTSNNATLDISGRDQQDQRLHLIRDEEKLIWQLERSEIELWKEPPDPILENIAEFVSKESWIGSPTELVEQLGLDIQPNALSKRLNVKAGTLQSDYSIRYENNRTHAGRIIKLTFDDTA